ncbi:MAG TPA: hypothetical protein VEN81_08380 [Planctomycetota bacterium]|nr:hypothetical protein [Planctomycetota bacterium]
MNLEAKFRDALERTSRALERLGEPWMLIGAIPVAAWGRARATTDIDFQTHLEVHRADALDLELRKEEFERTDGPLTIPQKPLALVKYWLGARPNAAGIGIDLFFVTGAWQTEGLSRRIAVTFGDRPYWVATPEDLLLYKLLAAREHDLNDIAGILERRYDSMDWGYVRLAASRIGLGLPSFLERILDQFRKEFGKEPG